MNEIFPYSNIVAGILVLIVGFIFHWLGQLISIIDWDIATKLGLQEKELPPEYKVYEHANAIADVAIGWLYGIAGFGLLLGVSWGYKLAWIPGAILLYHGISFWFWNVNQRNSGHKLNSDTLRIGWTTANLITGLLAITVAWNGS
ncbi:MAG: hypothetical protein GY839_01735 [candidate division Zixibacteria bacterium]|nr:hypothetical protein [candidate division Zixibacteria bacterium]